MVVVNGLILKKKNEKVVSGSPYNHKVALWSLNYSTVTLILLESRVLSLPLIETRGNNLSELKVNE